MKGLSPGIKDHEEAHNAFGPTTTLSHSALAGGRVRGRRERLSTTEESDEAVERPVAAERAPPQKIGLLRRVAGNPHQPKDRGSPFLSGSAQRRDARVP